MQQLLVPLFPCAYRAAVVLVLCFGLGLTTVASANVLFELSLPGNGEFGATEMK